MLDNIEKIASVKVVCPDEQGRWGTEIEVTLRSGLSAIVSARSYESHLDVWRLTRTFKKLSVEDRGDEYDFGRYAVHIMDDEGIATRYVESVSIKIKET